MTLSWWVKVIIVAAVIAIALVAVRLHMAGGQEQIGDAAAGRHLAEAWCTECHSVERATAGVGRIAPDFSAVAARPSTTALSLRAFLQSEHKTMPNFIIERRHADDLIAYILSLRAPSLPSPAKGR